MSSPRVQRKLGAGARLARQVGVDRHGLLLADQRPVPDGEAQVRFAAALLAVGTMPVIASPGTDNNAADAADAFSGTGCYVKGTDTAPYRYDASCEFHRVEKFNKDGSRAWIRYQDKGTLQPGNAVPETGGQWELTQAAYGTTCFGKEIATPSGQYSSDLLCTFN